MFYVLVSFNYNLENFASFEEAERHYLENHVALARTLPGLQKYVVGPSVALWPTAAKRHRAAILGFESAEALKAAYRSEVGKRLQEDERRLVTDPVVVLLDEAEELL